MKEQSNQPKTTRVQRIVAIALTVVFIPAIFGFGVYGLLSDPAELVESLKFYKARKHLADPEDVSFFPMLSARISSLQTQLGDTIPFVEELGYLNADFQYALGKQMVTQGSEQLLSLPEGQIYNITTRQTLAAEAQEIVDFRNALDPDIPFLFAYVSPQFYEGSLEMPAGYDVIDRGEELADEVLGIVREAGIETLDSREFFRDLEGYADNDLVLKTDMHWTTLAALLATPIYVDEINRLTGSNLDASKIALDQFDVEVYEDYFLGEYGQQIGERNSGLDDIEFYLPKYDTDLTRYSINRDGTEEHASGPFSESVVKWDSLDLEPDGTNISGYTNYGLIERLEEITNNTADCEDMTILIFRDSYTAPIGSFLSLLAKNVVMVDMRTMPTPATELVARYAPDIVIVSFSRPMLEDHNYEMS